MNAPLPCSMMVTCAAPSSIGISDAGQWPQAVERHGAGYWVMNTQLAWVAWQAACSCYLFHSCQRTPSKVQEPI